jgi:hypothetical protein
VSLDAVLSRHSIAHRSGAEEALDELPEELPHQLLTLLMQIAESSYGTLPGWAWPSYCNGMPRPTCACAYCQRSFRPQRRMQRFYSSVCRLPETPRSRSAEEQAIIDLLERVRGRPLTEREINLSLEQARALGEL